MGLFPKFTNPFKGRQPGGTQTQQPVQSQSQQATTPQGPTTGPLDDKQGANEQSLPRFEKVQGGEINLVNYSPEELMLHIEGTLSTVHFGMSGSEKFKEWAGEIWDVIGPMVLLAGTAGEVFAFIWGYSDNPAWWVGISVLATVIVLEATFMVVSYKSSTKRNRAEGKPSGATDQEKAVLKRYKYMWVMLAVGVGVGQAAFLISAMNAKMNNMVLLVTFAIARTVFTLASDYYTAFVHERKPTEGEEAKHQQQQRAALTNDLLVQKSKELDMINAGILQLQRTHTNAEIEQDSLHTELKMKKLENKNRIKTLESQAEQAVMFTSLGNNMMRALFDPSLPDDQREKLLGTMQGFMSAMRHLPSPETTIIEEEEDT
ncbi:hypothetical protein [Ktedonobacter racemifer]|uniref:Uncharacterized protein n=1 Tax=Ktedonobacter racemifer DSM 44963 TaxID=485913 RepID=D6TGH7_KTERA|nr:hypothetical protein [Ktedonobacter racemifer]EFH90689.1 hypothetical protein Krac_12322 [Ktedonobacter racemifer DSM 44963]